MRRLIGSSIFGELVRAGLGGAQLLVLSYGLGVELFGSYSIVFAASAILQPIAYLGAVYWIQPYLADASNSRAALSHLVLWGLISAVTLAPLASLLLALSNAVSFTDAYLLLLGEAGASLLAQQCCLVLLGLRRVRSYVVWTTALGLGRVLSGVLAISIPSDVGRLALLGLSQILLLGGFVGCFLVWIGWRPGDWTTAFTDNRRRLLGFSIVGLLQILLDNLDKILISFVMSPGVVGLVGMASRINTYALIPSRGYALVIYPQFFALVQETAAHRVPDLASHVGRRGAGVTVASSMGLLVAAWILETFLLAEFAGLTWVTFALGLRLWFRPLVNAFGDAVYALESTRSRIRALSVTALIYVGGVIALVPLWGVWGLACIGLVAEIMNMAMLRRGMNRAVQARGKADGG